MLPNTPPDTPPNTEPKTHPFYARFNRFRNEISKLFGWSVRLGLRLGVGVTVLATPTSVEAFYLLAFWQIGVTLGSFCALPRKIMRPAQRNNIPCPGNSSINACNCYY